MAGRPSRLPRQKHRPLRQGKYNNTEAYYLVIADENGLQVQREEFQIDIAFAIDEFDFFA